MAAKYGLFVDEDHSKLPTLYWLTKLHKPPYKSRFIANSSACKTTELSILLTSCLTAIKNRVIKYCTTFYEINGKNLFWSIKNSGEILNKLKSRVFLAYGLSTYDFSTLYTRVGSHVVFAWIHCTDVGIHCADILIECRKISLCFLIYTQKDIHHFPAHIFPYQTLPR